MSPHNPIFAAFVAVVASLAIAPEPDTGVTRHRRGRVDAIHNTTEESAQITIGEERRPRPVAPGWVCIAVDGIWVATCHEGGGTIGVGMTEDEVIAAINDSQTADVPAPATPEPIVPPPANPDAVSPTQETAPPADIKINGSGVDANGVVGVVGGGSTPDATPPPPTEIATTVAPSDVVTGIGSADASTLPPPASNDTTTATEIPPAPDAITDETDTSVIPPAVPVPGSEVIDTVPPPATDAVPKKPRVRKNAAAKKKAATE